MKKCFTLLDIRKLLVSFGNATMADDCLPGFLNSYHFENIYATYDGSYVFDAGGVTEITIEFFNFCNPSAREINIMYMENGHCKMLQNEFLSRISFCNQI